MEEEPAEEVTPVERRPRRNKPSGFWTKPPTKVYGYNFNLGEHYYRPLTSYLEKKDEGRVAEFPSHRSFAERLAEFPLCGSCKRMGEEVCHHKPVVPEPQEERPLLPRHFPQMVEDDFAPAPLPPLREEKVALPKRPRLKLPPVTVSDRILDVFGINPEMLKVKTPDDDVLYKEVDFHLFPYKGTDLADQEEITKSRSKVAELEAELEKVTRENVMSKHSNVMALVDSCLSTKKTDHTSEINASSEIDTSVRMRSRKMKATVTTEKETISY